MFRFYILSFCFLSAALFSENSRKISAELSLYPLKRECRQDILDYLQKLREYDGIEVRTHALSTEVFGEYDLVMAAIGAVTREIFETDSSVVLVAKYLNKDRSDR